MQADARQCCNRRGSSDSPCVLDRLTAKKPAAGAEGEDFVDPNDVSDELTPGATLFVCNIPPHFEAADVRDAFSVFGAVGAVYFVQPTDSAAATAAVPATAGSSLSVALFQAAATSTALRSRCAHVVFEGGAEPQDEEEEEESDDGEGEEGKQKQKSKSKSKKKATPAMDDGAACVERAVGAGSVSTAELIANPQPYNAGSAGAGLTKWLEEYNAQRPDTRRMQLQVDRFMQLFDQRTEAVSGSFFASDLLPLPLPPFPPPPSSPSPFPIPSLSSLQRSLFPPPSPFTCLLSSRRFPSSLPCTRSHPYFPNPLSADCSMLTLCSCFMFAGEEGRQIRPDRGRRGLHFGGGAEAAPLTQTGVGRRRRQQHAGCECAER